MHGRFPRKHQPAAPRKVPKQTFLTVRALGDEGWHDRRAQPLAGPAEGRLAEQAANRVSRRAGQAGSPCRNTGGPP
jgi:hypothetical protein